MARTLKRRLKEDNRDIYGGNPLVYEDALENMKNNRKLLKDRLKETEKAADEITKQTATEKVRLQGTKETTGPKLKPYTEAIDIKGRAELSELIKKANNEKKAFKIGRSIKEGFRYTFMTEAAEDDLEALPAEEIPVSLETGEPVDTPIDVPEEMPVEEPVEEAELTLVDILKAHIKFEKLEDGSVLISAFGEEEDKIKIEGLTEEELEVLKELFPEDEGAEEESDVEGAPEEEGTDDIDFEADDMIEEDLDTSRFGTEVKTFEQAQELSKDTAWVIKQEKYFNMYKDAGFRLFVRGEGKDKILTFVKGDFVTQAVDAEDKLITVEAMLGKEIKPILKEEITNLDGDLVIDDDDVHVTYKGKPVAILDNKKRICKVFPGMTKNAEFMEKAKEMFSEFTITESKPVKGKEGALNEEAKILSELSDFEPWSGAVGVWEIIVNADKLEALDFLLEDIYPEGLSSTELNDLLWHESDWVLDMLGLTRDGVVTDETEEPYIAPKRKEADLDDGEPEPIDNWEEE